MDFSSDADLFFQVRFGDKDLLCISHFFVSFHSSAFLINSFKDEQTSVLGYCEQVLIVIRHAHLTKKKNKRVSNL